MRLSKSDEIDFVTAFTLRVPRGRFLLSLLVVVLFISAAGSNTASAQTGTYTWTGTVNSFWNTPANWTESGSPAEEYPSGDNTAYLGGTNTIVLSSDISIDELGSGFVNTNGYTLSFDAVAGYLGVTGSGAISTDLDFENTDEESLSLHGSATAGSSTLTLTGSLIGFYDSSSAGTADIELDEATGPDWFGGYLTFYNSASAGQATIDIEDSAVTQFNGGTAGSAMITNKEGGTLAFFGTSTAGAATIHNESNISEEPDLPGGDGGLEFNDSSTAGMAQITNDGTIEFGGGNLFALQNPSADHAAITNEADGLINFNLSATAGSSAITNAGEVTFNDISTAGNAGITNESDGKLEFNDNSTAGSSTIINEGETEFNDYASAGSGSLTNSAYLDFYNASTAGSAAIQNSGTVTFQDTSSAGNAQLTNSGTIELFDASVGSTAQLTNNSGGVVHFNDSSSAGAMTINNSGEVDFYDQSYGSVAHLTNHSGGTVNFEGSFDAGRMLIDNSGSSVFAGNAYADGAGITNEVGGTLTFQDDSNAAGAMITNLSEIDFHDSATAGGATMANYSASRIFFFDNSTAGGANIDNSGRVVFEGSANAGGATITTNDDGQLYFLGGAHGDRAAVVTEAGSVTDISGLTNGGTSLGSIAGAGNYDLGKNYLAVGSLGTDTTVSGVISDGGNSGGFGGELAKQGAGTLILSGNNTYTGGTVVQGGTLEVDESTGSLAAGSSLTFVGASTFDEDNTNTGATNQTQSLGALTFSAGAGNVVATPGDNTLSTTLSFTSMTRKTGATGNFVDDDGENGLLTNGTVNKFVVIGQSSGFIDPGIFYGGNNYAAYDSTGFVRGINYGVDANSVLSSGGSTISGTLTSSSNVEITGGITAQTSATMNTLNLGNNSLTLGSNQTLTVNSILESGGSATISGGKGIAYGGFMSESDLVVRTDQAADSLTIETTITAASLTKTGAGTLYLNASYNGPTYLAGGSLGLGSGATVTGNISVESGSSLGGSGKVNGKVTVASGGSTYPGDPQILTASSVEYQNGSTAQFSIATTSGSAHPPVAGTDYDQLLLDAGPVQVLQIDAGTTTLQLNLSAASLAALQANARNNINDPYFVFNLGSGTSTGQFSDLTLTEGTSTFTEAITDGTAIFAQLGVELNLSYTADQANDSLFGGNDVAFEIQAVPEPSTWALLLGGLGLLVFWRLRPCGGRGLTRLLRG